MIADTVFVGRVFTADPTRRFAEAVAVADGIIIAVGDRSDVLSHYRSGSTEMVHATGLICPGFHDAHIHLLEGSLFDLWVNLHDTDSDGYLAVIEQAARALPDGAWVRGGGWTMSAFPQGNPDATALDAVTGARPAYLTARDGHSAWVNSAALRLAGIDARTADPPGGRIERDQRGEPTGALHETAMRLVSSRMPEITADEWAAALASGQRYLHSLGIVGWQDARLSAPMLDAYLDAERDGSLRAHVTAALHWDPGLGTDQITTLCELRDSADGPLVGASMVKIFVDGVVENLTASLHEPYQCSHSVGTPLFDPAQLRDAITTCVQAGFSVHVHSIGDAATTSALDAFAHCHDPAPGPRHQICHLQVVRSADIPRFAELGVIANVQALWACRDEQNVTLCRPALGPDRFEAQYPFGDLVRAGTTLAFGSDWRVSTPNPLPQIEVAVTRRPPGDVDTAPLGATQSLDLTTCLLGFTRNAAFAAGVDDRTGSLTVGRDADIVVLDTDPYTVEDHELGRVGVAATYFRGDEVHIG
ncbi:amidohydrolase [Mycobacterium sp. smrl_JER01]|uniref:amidohydrolase n=1 Tax=Mycobacterium sp. smrl_JER01 TaxID=3402633 RepID=UPI003AC50A3C